MNIFGPVTCIHSNHLFHAPLCPEQSLLKRIFNSVFHVFTCFFPLAIQRVYTPLSNLFTGNPVQRDNAYFPVFAADSVARNRPVKPYNSNGEAALDFAREELTRHPEITPHAFAAGWNSVADTNQPVNQEIARLQNLFWDVLFARLEVELKRFPNNPWDNLAVMQAADACMKVGYALSSLTLDDLPAFKQALETNRGETRTYALSLTRQDSYQYRTFFNCSLAYHWLRGELQWQTNLRDPNDGVLNYLDRPKESHAILFYQEGTLQNEWNKLYNDYCDRIRLYVDEKELEQADKRHFKWTQKDVGVYSFHQTPDTLPT